MVWSLDSERWEKMCRQFEKMGRPVPESAQQPELGIEDVFFLRAFLDLQHDKTSFRQIPWSALNSYGERYKLSAGLFEKLREVVFFCNDQLEEQFEVRRKQEHERQEKANKQAKRR